MSSHIAGIGSVSASSSSREARRASRFCRSSAAVRARAWWSSVIAMAMPKATLPIPSLVQWSRGRVAGRRVPGGTRREGGAVDDGRHALAGVTVLEPATGLAAGYCGRLLAMLGAEVIKIESSARPDVARTTGPFPGDEPHLERSGLHRFLHAQKQSVALD